MFQYKGFLAEAAREAAAKARAEVEKKAQRKLERMEKKDKLTIEAIQKETEKIKKEIINIEESVKKIKLESDILIRLTIMKCWNKDLTLDDIAYIVEISHDEVRQLITIFEEAKAYVYSKTDIDTLELMKVSGLSEFEVKALLVLLQK